MKILWLVILSLGTLIHASGCGLLIGNVKPVEEKSEDYRVIDLSRDNPDWTKLRSKDASKDSGESSDITFQSKKSASIISLNSTCRPSLENQPQDIKEFTKLLLLGISDITQQEEKPLTLQGAPALETTVQGKLNDEEMKLRTVVVHRKDCVYDLMYVARPKFFDAQEADFSRFVTSLQLR